MCVYKRKRKRRASQLIDLLNVMGVQFFGREPNDPNSFCLLTIEGCAESTFNTISISIVIQPNLLVAFNISNFMRSAHIMYNDFYIDTYN